MISPLCIHLVEVSSVLLCSFRETQTGCVLPPSLHINMHVILPLKVSQKHVLKVQKVWGLECCRDSFDFFKKSNGGRKSTKWFCLTAKQTGTSIIQNSFRPLLPRAADSLILLDFARWLKQRLLFVWFITWPYRRALTSWTLQHHFHRGDQQTCV